MNHAEEAAHKEHLRQIQDHFRWRAEHMKAFAMLKRVEATLLSHEARILAHDAEIRRHEEAIAHGDAHAPQPPGDEHARFAQAHANHSEHHAALVDAVLKLEAFLSSAGGQ